MKKILIVVAILAVVGAGAFAVTSSASAQEAAQFGLGPGGPRGGEDDVMHEYMQAALADALGISVDDLQARLDDGESLKDILAENGYDSREAVQEFMSQVKETAVAAALADGAITEEEAERILSFEGKRGGHGGGLLNGELRPYYLDALADTFGISVSDLEARLDDGESLKDIAEEAGFEGDALKEALEAAKETAVAEALADGVITEEQAERILAAECGPRGPGGRRGPGGPGGGNGTFGPGSGGEGNG